MARGPEAGLYESIVALLRAHKIHVTRLAQARATQQTCGTPDLFLMWDDSLGRIRDLVPAVLWVEVKTRRGALSPAQRDWHEQAQRAGLSVAVWRSMEDAMAWLIREGLRKAP